MKTLHGKTIFVTGASGSLGAVVVEACLAVGANVVAGARRRTRLDVLRASLADHERLRVAEIDITDEAGLTKLFSDLGNRGTVDGTVHCAGSFACAPLVDTSAVEAEQLVRLNTLGTACVLSAALRVMMPQKHGSIVVVGSDRALEPAPELAIYGGSKAAAVHFALAAAREAFPSGVRVNALLPGTLDTEDNRQAMPGADRSSWSDPNSVARAAVWLLSDDARGTNGSMIRHLGNS